MNFKFYLSIITISLLLTSCKTQAIKQENEALNKQVMALHDETMANHGMIMGLVTELKTKTQDTTLSNLTFLDSIRTELDGVNEDMMDWMSGFHEPEKADEESIKYLKEQVEILTKLKTVQSQNINLAKQLLAK